MKMWPNFICISCSATGMLRTKNVHSSGILIGSPIHMDTQNNKNLCYFADVESWLLITDEILSSFYIPLQVLDVYSYSVHSYHSDRCGFFCYCFRSYRWNSILSTAAFKPILRRSFQFHLALKSYNSNFFHNCRVLLPNKNNAKKERENWIYDDLIVFSLVKGCIINLCC